MDNDQEQREDSFPCLDSVLEVKSTKLVDLKKGDLL